MAKVFYCPRCDTDSGVEQCVGCDELAEERCSNCEEWAENCDCEGMARRPASLPVAA